MYLADDFRPLLAGQDLAALERTMTPVVGVRADGTVAFRNDAWAAVTSADDALEGSPGDGRPLGQVLPTPLWPHVEAILDVARARRQPAELRLERPSPTRHRVYALRVTPLREGAALAVLRKVDEHPHQRMLAPPDPYKYVANGVVTQCAACRSTRRVAQPDAWDWVPAYVRRGLVTIQPTLCPTCARSLATAVASLRQVDHA